MDLGYTELAAASRPDALRAALAANAEELRHAADEHHGGEMASVRRASYQGHEIEVWTTYEITVDGRPFDVHLTVDNAGRVHYHGLPTRDFPSVIGLVKKAIDVFGDEFSSDSPVQPDERGPDPHHHDHGGGA